MGSWRFAALLLRRKYVLWRCALVCDSHSLVIEKKIRPRRFALVCERLRREPWMEALGMVGDSFTALALNIIRILQIDAKGP